MKINGGSNMKLHHQNHQIPQNGHRQGLNGSQLSLLSDRSYHHHPQFYNHHHPRNTPLNLGIPHSDHAVTTTTLYEGKHLPL